MNSELLSQFDLLCRPSFSLPTHYSIIDLRWCRVNLNFTQGRVWEEESLVCLDEKLAVALSFNIATGY